MQLFLAHATDCYKGFKTSFKILRHRIVNENRNQVVDLISLSHVTKLYRLNQL